MKLFVEPNDVLMFRDGKPFSGGDDHFARGTCPPPPTTMYGAFRSHILSLKWSEFDSFSESDEDKIPEHIKREIGTPLKQGALRLGQFLLARQEGCFVHPIYPLPRDVLQKKGESEKTVFVLKPIDLKEKNVKTDLPTGLCHMWYPSEFALERGSGYLSQPQMERYLSGKTPEGFIEQKDIFDFEDRTGIRKNRFSRSVETGGLYSVGYFRFRKDAGFVLEIDGTDDLPEHGIIRLGGDHRSARFSRVSWTDMAKEQVKKLVVSNRFFKIILISPAIFTNGWLPGGIDIKTMEGQINDIDVRMVGACIGKPIGIGGFDIVKKTPKIMKRAVPSGSVYLFEMKGNDIEKLFNNIWLKPLSDERKNEGFGISLIGGINHV
ncbi:MAG: type III-B CRISPR module-associated protein Cmr3 [Pseudomonadota bacterium]|nr:type III-B CRISPR module-associated protein Cmr3 [Pseudomonadota bacterium]HOD79558.1 type III-B CRISPR module-associated protein Cmr3 [Syntrophorhabdus sp.]